MKLFGKIFFASLIAWVWFFFSKDAEISMIFFFIILFALFFKLSHSDNSAIRDQYIEKLKENIRKNQEVNEEFSREKNITYKDFRKKEKK